MKIRAKNGGQTVDITLPATDMDMQYCMKCIGIEDIVPVCCISEVWDEPSYFGFLKGQTVSMDELNFLARRLDGMTEYEKRVVGVYSSETGIREMKQLINLTYSLQGLSLITDLTDGNRVGLRLYLDRHLAISEEEKSKMDFNAYAQKIFSEGKCKFLPHGILVDQGFQMEEVYNGKTFPEYIDRPDETVAVLSLENEAGDKEYLYLPTDISAMDKVKKRLNIAAFAEGIVNGIENIRLPESILPSPEDMCMSLQGDVQKLTLFNEMCQTVSRYDEANPNLKEQGDIVLYADEVLHIPGLGYDGLVGYSPIALAKNAIGISIACEEYGASFFGNGASPSGVLEHPGVIKNPERVRDAWQRAYGGRNAHKVAVLEEGMKFTPIAIPNNEAQFLETRKFQIEEIARMYRVPLHMIGDLDHATFSNVEHLSLDFVKYSLDPWIVRWEQGLQKALLSDSEKGKYFIKFNVDGLLRGDYASRMQGYATARQNGWMSANDIRELEDMNMIPDEEGGNLYLCNGSMSRLCDAGIAYADKKEESENG